MLRGYRGILIALVGLILACPSEGKETSGNEPYSNEASAKQLERIASVVDKLPKAQPEDGGCRPGMDNRQSNLCAQWKAADAAADAAWSAYVTFWAGVVGLLIGAGTLIAAICAAKFAKDAAAHTKTGANEAKRAADAAEKSLDLSKEVAQSDLRAWVDIDLTLDACSRNERFASIDVKIDLRNIGKTPALRTALSVKAYVAPSVIHNYGALPSTNETPHQITPIFPGKAIDGKIQARIESADIAAGVSQARKIGFEPIIIIDAIVHYHTIFDAEDAPKRLTSVRYVMVNTIQRGSEFRATRMGWLDKSGPVEAAQVTFARHKGAPVYLT